ncbi:transketolase [Candidatus Deianiraea vastatrix]|uniref:Transketolase n=1 Tax=Candidatus Deianiraea vastatrix TaxID=2163644 RepID=A0A5B8XDN8_9RICK|nr:transketolase [Candidatus Deianiraea vastatrix]QED23383.1 Transketolase 1 [Candidatus Deianiraea vastatrix]
MEIFEKYNLHENKLANCIRCLTMDAIHKSNSGHPGMPMGMADIATVLFKEFINFNPNDATWQNRDRFIVSNGHGSMLLYSILYLTGYKGISIDDIKNFRQLHSKATGHPESNLLEGVEVSTGPLGQGLANAVGIALAIKNSNTLLSSDLTSKVYCTVGDGCLMEGISQEAITFASHYGLDNLIVIFDNNSISIDGKTTISTSENQSERFKAAGWDVIDIDGHNIEQIRNAFSVAKISSSPVFINAKTIIGFGDFENQGTQKVHGSPISQDAINNFKKAISWKEQEFSIPQNMLSEWRKFSNRCKDLYEKTQKIYDKNVNNESISLYTSSLNSVKNKLAIQSQEMSTRQALNVILSVVENDNIFIYGSADLASSTMIKTSKNQDITKNSFRGNYINFGIREHAMAAIANGISIFGDKIPMISTFLVFSDYMRGAIRMSALMKQKVFYVFTHDSICVGEDGPTHQPIEHVSSLRLIPNLQVFRPSCQVELCECLSLATEYQGPSAFILSRQSVKFVRNSKENSETNMSKMGGYTIYNCTDSPKITIIATGSEVGLSVSIAKTMLLKYGIQTNVVSMPCISIFEEQSKDYKDKIINTKSMNVAIEFGNGIFFEKYIKKDGLLIDIKSFGESGKCEDILDFIKLKEDDIVLRILQHYKKTILEIEE